MERVHQSDAFFAAPAGRYLATEGLLYWCESPRLWGITAYGVLTQQVAKQLSDWIDEEHQHPHTSYVTAVDLSRVTGVELEAFAQWQAWFTTNRPRQRVRVERAAIVRPRQGLPAMLVAGVPVVLAPDIPWSAVEDLSSALLWLGIETPETAERIDAAFEEYCSAPHALTALRTALARDPRAPELERIATKLGMSRRSLQRALTAAGTNFSAEVLAARVHRAQEMMLAGEHKLSVIAIEVGFTTQAHFSTVFRRLVGTTPSQWLQQSLVGKRTRP